MKTATTKHRVLLAAALAHLAACLPSGQRPPCRLPRANGEVGSVCGFQNPEDLEHIARAGLVLVSNMNHDRRQDGPGYLSALDPIALDVRRLWPADEPAADVPEPSLGHPDCVTPPEPEAFYPHGLTSVAVGGHTLVYVVAHAGARGGREAIELFALTGSREAARLTWKACIPTDNDVQANDVTMSPSGDLIVSNYQPNSSLFNTLAAAVFGRTTGDVMAWRPEQGWRRIQGTEAAMANGVAATRDGQRILYSETMTGAVHRTALEGGGGRYSLQIGGNPDNFTWTAHETLLITTHTGGAALLLCRFGRAPCKTSWEIYEIDPSTMAVRRVSTHDGSRVGAVATALQLDQRIYLGSIYDDRVGVISMR